MVRPDYQKGEPAFQRGAGSFFFPNIANLLYNEQAINEPGGQW